MAPDPKLNLPERVPWSEPAWYRELASPYYKVSHRQLRDSIRRYVDTHVLPSAPEWESAGEVPAEERLRMAQSGMAFGDVPDMYRPSHIPLLAGIPHGQLDVFHYLIGVDDELARIEGGVSLGMDSASSISVPPIVHYGSDEQKARWLPGLFSCETSFCLGVTEPNGGSDVALVNGAKKWISGSVWATHMTTAVHTGGPGLKGISVLVIPLDAAGVVRQRIDNSGQNAGGTCLVLLDDVRVPAANLIGEENAGFDIMKNFNKERFALAVQCNRKSRTCLASALAYALQREAFGQLLIGSQVIRRKLAELAHRVEAHWAWLEQLAFHVQQSPQGWQSSDLASRIAFKVQGGQMLELAAREAQQIFGGAGYQRAGPGAAVEQISRDLRMLVVGGGSEEFITDLAIRQELVLLARSASRL